MPSEPLPLKELIDPSIEADATEHLSDLCHGRKRWRMCIPARPEDSDLIFGRALRTRTEMARRLKALSERHQPVAGVVAGTYTPAGLICKTCRVHWPCPDAEILAVRHD